jgi:hypothetical protein
VRLEAVPPRERAHRRDALQPRGAARRRRVHLPAEHQDLFDRRPLAAVDRLPQASQQRLRLRDRNWKLHRVGQDRGPSAGL